MDDCKEKDLLSGTRKGDLTSFEIIFQTCYQPLCNFAYLFLKDTELSRDVVSDVFVNFWQKRNSLTINESIKAYLYKSTKNALISHIRKNRIIFTDKDENTLDPILTNTPETILLKKEFQNKLDQLIQELPKKSGLVFRMKKIDGFSYKEIAGILDISEKTVENHITIAVKKIREAINVNPDLEIYFKS